jgi:hypothetical protein
MPKYSFCGLDCSDCPCFIAHQNGNEELMVKTAKKWRELYGWANLKPDDINCVGCLSTEGSHFKNCEHCGVRKCGLEKGVKNCGECPDYQSCPKIRSLHHLIAEGKGVCDKVWNKSQILKT